MKRKCMKTYVSAYAYIENIIKHMIGYKQAHKQSKNEFKIVKLYIIYNMILNEVIGR